MCSLKCHKETAEITLLNNVDWTRRVKTIPPNTTNIRMTVWVTVNHPSTRWRNRNVYSSPTHEEQTTNATTTHMLHGRLHNAQSTLRSFAPAPAENVARPTPVNTASALAIDTSRQLPQYTWPQCFPSNKSNCNTLNRFAVFLFLKKILLLFSFTFFLFTFFLFYFLKVFYLFFLKMSFYLFVFT